MCLSRLRYGLVLRQLCCGKKGDGKQFAAGSNNFSVHVLVVSLFEVPRSINVFADAGGYAGACVVVNLRRGWEFPQETLIGIAGDTAVLVSPDEYPLCQ